MNYPEWVEFVDKCRLQLTEGAITSREFFNAVLAKAVDVEQTEIDPELVD